MLDRVIEGGQDGWYHIGYFLGGAICVVIIPIFIFFVIVFIILGLLVVIERIINKVKKYL
jgi:uncharacterized membrane protein